MSELGNLLSEEITQTFSKETKQEQLRLLKTWTSLGYSWMNSARSFLLQGEELIRDTKGKMFVMPKTTFSKLSGSVDAEKNLNQFFTTYQQTHAITLQMEQLLAEGYQLLNNIGERIRGQALEYHVILTDTGGAVSGKSVVTSFWLNMEQLLTNLTNFGGQRMRTKTGKGAYQNLMSLTKKTKENPNPIKFHNWTQEELLDYRLFALQVEGEKNIDNAGNLLEAYYRFNKIYGVNWTPFNDHEYWRGIYVEVADAVDQTMKEPDPFTRGGDVGNEQMKALGASITNLATLINLMTDFFNVIEKSPINEELLGNKVRSSFQPQYDIMEDQLVPALEKLFTPNNLRVEMST